MPFSKASPAQALRSSRQAPRSAVPNSSRRRGRRYSQNLKGLARFLWEQGRTLTHATEKDAAAWVRALKREAGVGRNRPASPAVFRKIAAARTLFERLKHLTLPNPFARFKTRRSDRPLEAPLPLRSPDFKQLIQTMNLDSPWGLRNRAIALLRFGTPLRLSEICHLKRSQLIFERRGPAIRLTRKGFPALKIPLHGPVLAAIRKHLQRNRPKGPYLFQAMPSSHASPRPGTRRRSGKSRPLSPGWVSAMLVQARLAASRMKGRR
jgi:site-specific recombinase XerD